MAVMTQKILQPGDKIYNLFDYQEVVVKGSKESFIIRIEKVDTDQARYEQPNYRQYVRAMG